MLVCYSAFRHPIKANPVKAGDAKLWVYHHFDDHDRQAAEDYNDAVCICLAYFKSGFLFRMAVSTFISKQFV